MKHVELRQWIRDLRGHCTSEELCAFLRISATGLQKHTENLDKYNDEVIRRRFQREHVGLHERAHRRRAILATMLPLDLTYVEIARKYHTTPDAVRKDFKYLGRYKHRFSTISEDDRRFHHAYKHPHVHHEKTLDDAAMEAYELRCLQDEQRIRSLS